MGKIRKDSLDAERLSVFFEQIAMILKAGLPLRDGMEALCRSYEGSAYEAGFAKASRDMQSGEKLSEALSGTAMVPSHALKMIEIGEQTGTLDIVCESLSEEYDREAVTERAIKDAVVYPSALAVMLAVIIGVLVLVVTPIFSRIFSGLALGIEAAPMSAAVSIGRVLLALSALLVVLCFVMAALLRSKDKERLIEFFCSVFPYVGTISQTIGASKFASVSGMALKSGFDISEIPAMAREVIRGRRVLSCVDIIEKNICEGASFADAVCGTDMFGELHKRMISVAGSVGQLDEVMDSLAGIYARDANDSIENAVSLVEPALVALLSLAIGGILLSAMLPLIGILSAMI